MMKLSDLDNVLTLRRALVNVENVLTYLQGIDDDVALTVKFGDAREAPTLEVGVAVLAGMANDMRNNIHNYLAKLEVNAGL